MSMQEEGSYRGQREKSWPRWAGIEEEEEDGMEEEEDNREQLPGKVEVPLACSLLPWSPRSRSQTSDVLCSCLPGCRAERAEGNREVALNNAESLGEKGPRPSPPHLPITHTHGESLFPANVSLTPL